MKKRIGRAVALGIFAAALVFGCIYEKEDRNEVLHEDITEGWQFYADQPVTLDWYVNFPWFDMPWGGNLVSDTITEETGVSIDFITPSGSGDEKINALIASDSLPDILTLGWWEPETNQIIKNDMVYALNELGEKYDTYFFQVTDPAVVDLFTREDGNVYCYPGASVKPEDLNENAIYSYQNFLVRRDIYEAIGKPDMTTQEGFHKAIKRASEMFPEVNGKPLIPIGASEFNDEGCKSFDEYLMNFLAVPYEEDGKYYDRVTDEEYVSWLLFFSRLSREGYLHDDIFIDKRMQIEEKIAEGRYFCMFYQSSDMEKQQKMRYANDPDSIYIAVDGPKNSRRDDYRLPCLDSNGWSVTMISKSCEYPERAISFLDYMMSERGQKLMSLGVEGVTYDLVDGRPVVREKAGNLLNTDRQEYDRMYGADNAYFMMKNSMMQLEWQQEQSEPMAQLREWTYPYVIYSGQYDSLYPTSSHFVYVRSMIAELWKKTLPQLLLAESDEAFDKKFEDFVEKREELGFVALQEEYTRLMESAKEKLGIK